MKHLETWYQEETNTLLTEDALASTKQLQIDSSQRMKLEKDSEERSYAEDDNSDSKLVIDPGTVLSPSHLTVLSNLLCQGPTTMEVICEGGKVVATHTSILSLHSPTMAKLLLDIPKSTDVTVFLPESKENVEDWIR